MEVRTARRLAFDQLATELPRRWSHVQAVGATTERLSQALDPGDRATLICAGWLHDIGYASTVSDTGFHPLDGARFLRSLGADERLCALVAHHSAARVEAGIRGLEHDLDAEFVEERSLTSDLLWLADMTTGPDGQVMSVRERLDEIASRYGVDHPVARATAAARPLLLAAAQRGQRTQPGGQSTCAEGEFAIP